MLICCLLCQFGEHQIPEFASQIAVCVELASAVGRGAGHLWAAMAIWVATVKHTAAIT
jgi:hypothetical protein